MRVFDTGVQHLKYKVLRELARQTWQQNDPFMGFDDFEFKPIVCDGLDKCKSALMRARKGVLPYNFIEGMICEGGCIGGAACLTHGSADVKAVDDYGDSSEFGDITSSIEKYL